MTATTARVLEHRADSDPARGFAGPRDFLAAVYSARRARDRDSVADHRLRALSVREGGSIAGSLAFALPLAFTPKVIQAAAGSDEQGTYADPYGGFAVRSPTVAPFALGAVESDPTAGRTLVLPMDAPQLSVTTRVGTTHATSVTGGLEVVRTAETVSRASSRMKLEAVVLEASTLFGFSFVSEELPDSPAAFAAILAAAYRDEIGATLLRGKLTGLGGNHFQGALPRAAGSLEDVAAEVGVSYASLKAWADGRRNPSPENLTRLAEALARRSGELRDPRRPDSEGGR